MTIYYNATDRKPLVNAISEFTGAKAVYLKTPTYAYQIDYITVSREGNLVFDDMADSEETEKLIAALAAKGFIAESSQYDSTQQEPVVEDEVPLEDCPPPYGTSQDNDPCGICISMPRGLFTEQNIANLHSIVEAKGILIRKALGTADLPIEVSDSKIGFPWFPEDLTPDEMNAYESFVCRLCDMARNQKRVTAKEKDADNEKYAFRCFLLRLGFIGDEFKVARKILLRNFTGSSAFKSGSKAKEEQL